MINYVLLGSKLFYFLFEFSMNIEKIVLMCILLTFIFFSIVKLIKYKILYKYEFYRYIYYIFAPHKKHQYELRETYYELFDKFNMLHKKKFKVKSFKNNYELFEDRFRWSKFGKCVVKPNLENQKLIHMWEEDGWTFYSINLNKKYKKGETFEVLVTINNLKDENKESKSYLSTGIYEKNQIFKYDC